MPSRAIYNCHIHTLTSKNAPANIIKLKFAGILGDVLNIFARYQWFLDLLIWLIPGDNDILEREARFLKTGGTETQAQIFQKIEAQYPDDTKFIILPMDLKFAGLKEPAEKLKKQHEDLLDLAKAYKGRIFPFYAVDPRRENIVEDVRKNLGKDKFRGIKIYPNLGYYPTDKKLMEIYAICEEGGFPVMTHCSPDGVWKFGFTREDRIKYSRPGNYIEVLTTFKKLNLCLAHFGGQEEWVRRLEKREEKSDNEPWVKTIYDMLDSGKYPNLYTDISYTVFMPKIKGMYIDLIDYLKVLLSNKRVASHVLFGSDFYMSEQEKLSEKEVSIMLRSRLGEELFFQIAHTNPMIYLGIKKKAAK